MRYQPSFLSPPSDVPFKQQNIKPAEYCGDVLSEENEDLLKTLFSQIDVGLLRLAEDLLNERQSAKIATMKEPSQQRFSLASGFVIAQEGEKIKLISVGKHLGRVLCSGDSSHIFHYVSQFSPQNFSYLVTAARKGIIKHPSDTDLWDRLDSYREGRSWSTGLDKLSKMWSLELLDQDVTTNKFFRHIPSEPGKIAHLGSGRLFSRSLFAFCDHDVVGVDPASRNGPHTTTSKWQDVDLEKFDTIISDVAIGADSGLAPDELYELGDECDLLSERGKVVIAKMFVGSNHRAKVLCKPRPHNMEVIIKFDPTAPFLESQGINSFDKANRKRNEACFRHEFPREYKAVYNTPSELKRFIRFDYSRFLVLTGGKMSKRDLDRNKFLIFQGGVKTNRKRKMLQLCYDPFAERHLYGSGFCLLPRNYIIKHGPLIHSDPGICGAEFSFYSVWKTAVERGFKVTFKHNGWCVEK